MHKLCYILSLLFLANTTAIAQKTTGDASVPVFFEKAYLHTDRDTYAQGEDLWFKAYIVNAQNNQAIDYSKNLYVELINPAAKIVQRKMLRLENGLANGDFKLPDTLTAGDYRLRAYTNWMRNFGDNFIFEKSVRLVGILGAAKVATNVKAVKKQANKPPALLRQVDNDTLPTVRFYPESGAMINGVNSVIAVKSEDAYGRGVAAVGDVVDNNNTVIARFSCDTLGFGAFTISPIAGQHYQAIVVIRGGKHRFVIPDAKMHGINIAVINGSPLIRLVLNCSEADLASNQGSSFTIIIKHGEKKCESLPVTFTGKNTPVVIPNDELPEGIAAITVTDWLNNPVCERLVYIHHPEVTQLTVSADKSQYQPKDKSTIGIKLNTNTPAHLSLAVVDANVSPVPAENILSYIQLQSEIKGEIEHAARYFETTNINRFNQLDLLLLTQGWRGFVWKRLADTSLTYDREIEQGINVTGKVRKVWGKAPMAGINITMRAPKAAGDKLFAAITDTAGRFSIYGAKFFGYQLVNFTARRSDKIKADGRSKGQSSGWLQVDSLAQDTLPVNKARRIHDVALTDRETLSAIEKIKRSLNLQDDRNLKEVKITGDRDHIPPTILPITLAEQKEYGTLGQYLMFIVDGANVMDMPCFRCVPPDPTVPPPLSLNLFQGKKHIGITGVYADHAKKINCEICPGDYLNMPMSEVLKVTINHRDNESTVTSVDLIIRPGVFEIRDYFDNTTADFTGYAVARVFYEPKFGSIDDKPDPRVNTIHWEPNIITDAKGEAAVSFYNTALTGKMRIVVQGITQNGEPVVATASYTVK